MKSSLSQMWTSVVPWGFRCFLAGAFAGTIGALFAHDLQAQIHPCRTKLLQAGETVSGGDQYRFQLAGDDRFFKLDGLLAPENSTAALAPGPLELFSTRKEPDRYGRIPVHAFRADNGNWVQGELLRQGQVVQYAFEAKRGCLGAIRKAESEARQAKRGLWQDWKPFDAGNTDDLLQHTGEFVIVTGIVKSVGDRERRLYLNFGSNWAEDTTAIVVKKGSGAYRGDVAVLRRLEGKRIEIRGVLEDTQGPLIRLIDEAQIDFSGD